MQQTEALRHVIEFLDANKDLPKVDVRITAVATSWRVGFILPDTALLADTTDVQTWAYRLGVGLVSSRPRNYIGEITQTHSAGCEYEAGLWFGVLQFVRIPRSTTRTRQLREVA